MTLGLFTEFNTKNIKCYIKNVGKKVGNYSEFHEIIQQNHLWLVDAQTNSQALCYFCSGKASTSHLLEVLPPPHICWLLELQFLMHAFITSNQGL